MNNDCHIGSASAVMNARVTISIILSLLVLLPSPSVCQGYRNVAQNSPPVYNVLMYNARPNQYYTAYNPRQEAPPRQKTPQNSSPNRNNSYYSVRQEASQNTSSDRNNDYYSVCQETPQNGLSNRPTYNTRIENTNENRPFNSRDCLLLEQPEGGHYELREICPPLRSTSVEISCNHKGELVSCIRHVLSGTRAMLTCKPSYTLFLTNNPAYRKITCLEDGLWDNRVFRCLSEYRTSIAHGNTLIVNGLNAKVGVFPWHVDIYSKRNTSIYEQICGDTLISSNLVISAAHCFYDEIFNKVNDASNYAVSAGKYYRNWDTKEDYSQKSSVESMQFKKQFKKLINKIN